MPDADWWQALWPDPVTVLAQMGVQPGMVVVDLCCGDGLFTAPLARIVDGVYAIDIDPAMLDRARALVAAAGSTNCHLVVADAMSFDAVVPEPVDYVFLANTLHGVPGQLGLARTVVPISNRKGNSGSSIGIVVLVRKRWSSGSLADRGRRCGWKPAMSR
jgi:SAM-dependent methyltransferase